MLQLSRKIGQSIIIDDGIEVKILGVRGQSVKVGITYPSNHQVLRREVYDRIQEENHAAANSLTELRYKILEAESDDETHENDPS